MKHQEVFNMSAQICLLFLDLKLSFLSKSECQKPFLQQQLHMHNIYIYVYTYTCIICIYHNIYEISSRDNTHHFFLLHLYPLWSPPIGSTQPVVFRLQRLQWKLRYSKGSSEEMDGETFGNAQGENHHVLASPLTQQPVNPRITTFLLGDLEQISSFATLTGLGVDPNHVYRCG